MIRAFASAFVLALLPGTVCAQATDKPPVFEAADVHGSPHRTDRELTARLIS
jgi:hypothetical protein